MIVVVVVVLWFLASIWWPQDKVEACRIQDKNLFFLRGNEFQPQVDDSSSQRRRLLAQCSQI